MTPRLKSITEQTLIPISLVAMIIVGVWGLSEINSKASAAVDAANSAQATATNCQATITHIDERLSRMEGKLDTALGR